MCVCRLRVLTTDLQVVSDVLSLPIMEPLAPARVQQVAVLALACLYAAEEMVIAVSVPQSQAVGSQKMNNHDTDLEQCAATIVESAVSVWTSTVFYQHLQCSGYIENHRRSRSCIYLCCVSKAALVYT